MDQQVSPQVKDKRSDRLQDIAGQGAKAFFDMNLALAAKGRTERVLLEEVTEDGKYITGYTGNYIRTYIPYSEELQLNTFVTVHLEDYHGEGLEASVVNQ